MRPGDDRETEQEIKVDDRRRFTSDGELKNDAEGADNASEETAMEVLPQTVPVEELQAAQDRAHQAELRLDEFRGAFQRYKDEHDAVRSRLERDVEARVRATLTDTFAGLIGALDDLDRALEYADDSPLAEGMHLVRRRILDVLAAQGLVRLDVVDKPFDPEFAEAVGIIPVDDPARHDVVIEEVRSGYAFGPQVLRAAQVRVGRSG